MVILFIQCFFVVLVDKRISDENGAVTVEKSVTPAAQGRAAGVYIHFTEGRSVKKKWQQPFF